MRERERERCMDMYTAIGSGVLKRRCSNGFIFCAKEIGSGWPGLNLSEARISSSPKMNTTLTNKKSK